MSLRVNNKKQYKSLRSYFRKNMPAPEILVWQKLRGKVTGSKFRRQFSVENYILDFYSPSAKLAIEIDGQSHYKNRIARLKDEMRDNDLKSKHGVKVLRFTNDAVMQNLDGVFTKIIEELSTTS